MLAIHNTHQHSTLVIWPLSDFLEAVHKHDYLAFGQQLGALTLRSIELAVKVLQRTMVYLPFIDQNRVDRNNSCAREFQRGFAQHLGRTASAARQYDEYFLGAQYSRNLAEFVESRQLWQYFDELLQQSMALPVADNFTSQVIPFKSRSIIIKP